MKIPLFLFPVISSAIKKLNNDIQRHGLQSALATLLSNQKTSVNVLCNDENAMHVLGNESVIVVSNETHGIEPIVLFAAMPSRKNAYVIANEQFMHICPALDNHIIPVSIQHVLNKASSKSKRIKLIKTILPVERVPIEEAKQKNKQSIKDAQDRLANGSLVLIFPGVDIKGPFLPGVGRMIQDIKTDKPVYIINSCVKGTSRFDFLRLLPVIRRLLPVINVYFSSPKRINHHTSNDLESICWDLKKDYIQWEKSLKN